MTHTRNRQPTVQQPAHPIPADATPLAAPTQRAMPQAADLEPKQMQRRSIHRHTVVGDMPTHDRTQPLTLHRDRCMQAAPQFGFDLTEFRLQNRLRLASGLLAT